MMTNINMAVLAGFYVLLAVFGLVWYVMGMPVV